MTDNKRISNITNSTFGDNINMQGDNVEQSKTTYVGNPEIESAFKELSLHIEGQSKEIREQAEYNLEELKQSLKEGNEKKSKQLFSFLTTSLGNVSSLLTIGSFFGI